MMSSNGATSICVRDARPEDLDTMMLLGEEIRLNSHLYFPPINPEFTREMAKIWFANKDMFCVFVAEKDGEVVGMLTGACAPFAFSPEKRASIDLFHVFKAHRSYAVARRLLDAFMEWQAYLGAKMVNMGSSTGTDISPLAKRYGFDEVGSNYVRVH